MILSPTTTPPPSIGISKSTPKALRLISVVAEKPERVPPHGSGWVPLNSRSSTTGRVVPLMVRSPVTLKFDPAGSTLVDTKVILGWVSTSKESLERRWPSRCSSRVLMDERSTSTCTEEASGSSPMVMLPSKRSKLPFTLDTMRCRTLKPTSECDASIVQEPAGISGVVMVVSSGEC